VEGRGSRSSSEIEGRCRDVEGRASRGRDEDGRGGRIGAEKERRGRDVEGSRSGLERTFTGRGSHSLHIAQIYEFRSITYDLTSSNTGHLGGQVLMGNVKCIYISFLSS